MSGVINVIDRKLGEDDISFGANSYVYVDVNGVARRVNQVNAKSVPWQSIPTVKVEALVDGSKSLPVGASNLGVVNTSIFSGPVYGSGTTSGFVRNHASGLLVYGQTIGSADIPTGIPAINIGSGTVDDAEFGYLDGATSNIQGQIDTLVSSVATVARLKYFEPPPAPTLNFIGSATCNVNATADNPAYAIMNGFPDILNIQQFVTAGLVDSLYRRVTGAVSLTLPSDLYGSEQSDQWYAVFAMSTTSVAELGPFVLKAMPYLRVKSQASQQISCCTNLSNTGATGINYGFTANQFIDGYLYVLSGASKGQLRLINGNDLDGSSYTRISYLGTALTLSAGDWFIILPPGYNFRWLADVYNDGSGNLAEVGDFIFGRQFYTFLTAGSYIWYCPLTWNSAWVSGSAGGAGGIGGAGQPGLGGGAGSAIMRQVTAFSAGVFYTAVAGVGGAGADNTAVLNDGTTSYIGSVLSLTGGNSGNMGANGLGCLFGGGGSYPVASGPGGHATGYGAGGGGGNLYTGGNGADGFLLIDKAP